jgi:hypothetical protein
MKCFESGERSLVALVEDESSNESSSESSNDKFWVDYRGRKIESS